MPGGEELTEEDAAHLADSILGFGTGGDDDEIIARHAAEQPADAVGARDNVDDPYVREPAEAEHYESGCSGGEPPNP
jgi:hypothetical protein